MHPEESHYVRYYKRLGECAKLATSYALNALQTEPERLEQTGFGNLLKGIFGTFRNVTAHAPKLKWAIGEQDALDLLTMVSYARRRLDQAVVVRSVV